MIDLKNKRIVVTGGSGFLGSHLVDRLRQCGCSSVFVPTHKEFDLTRSVAIERLFDEFRPQVLIHGAAVVGGIGANRANRSTLYSILCSIDMRHAGSVWSTFLSCMDIMAIPRICPQWRNSIHSRNMSRSIDLLVHSPFCRK